MENVYYELLESEEGYVQDLEVVVEVRLEEMREEDREERWREGEGREEERGGGRRREKGERWEERE